MYADFIKSLDGAAFSGQVSYCRAKQSLFFKRQLFYEHIHFVHVIDLCWSRRIEKKNLNLKDLCKKIYGFYFADFCSDP